MMNQPTLAFLIVIACAAPAAADGSREGPRARACGEDAFTFAEVTENRPTPPRGTPIVSIPDTLCPDLADDRRTRVRDIQIVIDPRSRAEGEPRTR
jgi:hypothetical protein